MTILAKYTLLMRVLVEHPLLLALKEVTVTGAAFSGFTLD